MKTHSILFAFAIVFATTNSGVAAEDVNQFQFQFRDGTVISASFVDSQLPWTSVSGIGDMSKQSLLVSKIKSLQLAAEPASSQLADVLELVAQLDSDEYFVREDAEQALKKRGRRYFSVINQVNSLKTEDARYRLRRVLSSLRTRSSNDRFELDELGLVDGSKLSGDIGESPIKIMYCESELSLDRDQLSSIVRAHEATASRPDDSFVIQTKLYHDHASFMASGKCKLIDFEKSPGGVKLESDSKADVGSMFADFGLLLGTDYPQGRVRISGYAMESGDKPVGENSICVYQTPLVGSRVKKFTGVLEVRFCMPGKAWVPHGVNQFGVFLSRVNHSRDIIVQAWDANDRLIGICESTNEPVPFFGIQSNTPIAKVRILSNPWLKELREVAQKRRKPNSTEPEIPDKVDFDFAADSMMFSTPVPVDSVDRRKHFAGRNGDFVPATWVKLLAAGRIEFDAPNLKLVASDLTRASSVALKKKPTFLPKRLNTDTTWMAQLQDNSIFKWDPRKPFYSERLKRQIDRTEIVGIWPSGRPPQLPLAGDFDAGTDVLVFPGCRLATSNLSVDAKGYRWNDGVVLEEDLHASNEYKVDARDDDYSDDVAPAKTEYDFDFAVIPEFETPTIWFESPSSISSKHGILKCVGGEQFVYGKNSTFQITRIDSRNIILSESGKQQITVPVSDIVAIVPPFESQ